MVEYTELYSKHNEEISLAYVETFSSKIQVCNALGFIQYLTVIWWLFQELKRFPTLQSDIAAASNEALERFRDESRKTVLRLVDQESSYLTVEFFRKLQNEPDKTQDKNSDKNPNPQAPNSERYTEVHFRRIGKHSILYFVH